MTSLNFPALTNAERDAFQDRLNAERRENCVARLCARIRKDEPEARRRGYFMELPIADVMTLVEAAEKGTAMKTKLPQGEWRTPEEWKVPKEKRDVDCDRPQLSGRGDNRNGRDVFVSVKADGTSSVVTGGAPDRADIVKRMFDAFEHEIVGTMLERMSSALAVAEAEWERERAILTTERDVARAGKSSISVYAEALESRIAELTKERDEARARERWMPGGTTIIDSDKFMNERVAAGIVRRERDEALARIAALTAPREPSEAEIDEAVHAFTNGPSIRVGIKNGLCAAAEVRAKEAGR